VVPLFTVLLSVFVHHLASLSLHAEPPLSLGAHLSPTFFSFSVVMETAPVSLSATAAIEEPPCLATADHLRAISSVSFHSFRFYSLFPSPPLLASPCRRAPDASLGLVIVVSITGPALSSCYSLFFRARFSSFPLYSLWFNPRFHYFKQICGADLGFVFLVLIRVFPELFLEG
jgi:hypothetical protein